MIKGVLRLLGLDEETKRKNAEMEENIRRAKLQLESLDHRIEEASHISQVGRAELHKTLSESNFGDLKRKRSARA